MNNTNLYKFKYFWDMRKNYGASRWIYSLSLQKTMRYAIPN